MSDAAIVCTGLGKRYRRRLSKFTAVQDLHLSVPRGSTFGLLGPNGAGKTTTIQMVLGLVQPTTGSSTVLGGSISDTELRRRIGFVPEKFQLPTFLTAQEFLEIHAALLGLRGAARTSRVDTCLDTVNLADRRGDRLKGFSKGMQQRMMIAQALLGEPELLILDEPTSALDPLGRREVRELIVRAHGQGATVLLNSHLLAEVEAVCHEVAILRNGSLVHQGMISELRDQQVHATMRVGRWSDSLATALSTIVSGLEVGAPDAGDVITVEFALPSHDRLPAVAAAVSGAGADLYSLVPSGESLEDLFIRLVEADDDAAGQPDAPAPPVTPETPGGST